MINMADCLTDLTLTLKITSTQVVETSVANQQQFFSELHHPGRSTNDKARRSYEVGITCLIPRVFFKEMYSKLEKTSWKG